MITIVDYGMGNLGSIANMLKRIDVPAQISGDPNVIRCAERIILPGVGAFDAAMERIASSGLRDVLDERALVARVPVLGICLGMQLLTEHSEEGKLPGLGWVPGATLAFAGRVPNHLKIPHMGWNAVAVRAGASIGGSSVIDGEARFYFVHSYFVQCRDERDVAIDANYGIRFHAGLERDNILGVQFHPEKSHRFGMMLLSDFARL